MSGSLGLLGLDQAELDSCVACGLCLPHCPTYRVTGADTHSPRGRIALMQVVDEGIAPLSDEIVEAFDSCIQCRACETACPGDVPFGHLLEVAKGVVEKTRGKAPWWLKLGLRALPRPRLLRAGSSCLAVAQRLRLVPSQRLGLPQRLPVRRRALRATGDDVWLFTGCVMDAWQRDIHVATQQVIEATGTTVRPSGDAAPCCGAMHTHAGLGDDARRLAARAMSALEGDNAILVNSAGCGAALKDYGRLLGSDEARAFSARVFDVHEWLVDHMDEIDANPPAPAIAGRVAIQDPCHLRHVQGSHMAVRRVLEPFVSEIVELDDEGMCCGAGGAYSLVHRQLALDVRDRKTGAISRSRADVVVSANPGCSMHLVAAGLTVRHPMELVAEALRAR
ncbi:MAG: heterodisulfide reductase-related iron-sulfur binding cluster [Acidimicrobiaceae bacterium]|nr:heterodisulfide reductase-related iron-sulfur binding cluster [Acidimicrobiaceae bacterium]